MVVSSTRVHIFDSKVRKAVATKLKTLTIQWRCK